MRILTTAAIALAATLAAAGPASAVVTTFASFGPGAGGANVYFLNAGSNGNALFFTTATNTSTTQGARTVSFTFLQNAFNAIGPVNAKWTLSGAVTNSVAIINGANITQSNIAGSFSYISTSAITLGSTTYAAGSNLLSGTFTNSSIQGVRNATAGGFTGSTPASSITYSSDFLTFIPGSAYDFSISLSQIAPALNALPTSGTPTRALRTFRAVAGGQFSADPAPIPNVPEPAIWLQLITGFGLVGLAARRRITTVAA
jgi:hypothetical protein